jgi:putative glutamine amidotransferase
MKQLKKTARIRPSAKPKAGRKSITIGITDCSKFSNYAGWISSDKVRVLKLSFKKNNLTALEKCDGLILSGGEDVHPKYYGHPEWLKEKEKLKLYLNKERDQFEMKILSRAFKKKMPLLGICRGLQIANVYLKGSLIPDIKGREHCAKSARDAMHAVKINKNSLLHEVNQFKSLGSVNSAHHQAAGKIAPELKVSARAEDGTIEALEWKNPETKPFLILVQWHPERMKEQENPLAKKIKDAFLENVQSKIKP